MFQEYFVTYVSLSTIGSILDKYVGYAMRDSFLSFALLFSKQEIIIPLTIIGFYFSRSSAFVKSLMAILGAMVIGAALKSFFQIPLKPHLGTGYAFPSGHMFAATVFWLILTWELRQKLLSLAVIIILSGIGIALVHFNYHDPIDVLAGLGFGLIFVISHILLHHFILVTEVLYGLIMLIISLGTALTMTVIPGHLYMSFGALAGLTLGSLLFHVVPQTFRQQVIGLVLCGMFIIFGFMGIPYILHMAKTVVMFWQYLWIGFSLRFSAQVVSKI
jgi:undecaprenyl-diphosphatase